MKRLIPIVLLSAFIASCASKTQKSDAPSESAPISMEEATADEDRAGADGVEAERRRVGVEDLVRTNNQFAFDLLKSMPPDNLVYSPHSVSSALAILYAGAEGDTAEQIRQTTRFEISEKDVHQKFGLLQDELRGREKVKGRDGGRGFRLRVVNGVWYDRAVNPTSKFLRIAHNKHLAEVGALDFRSDAEKARKEMNGFIADATAGKVAELLGPGRVNALTRLVIANAVYFDAPWLVPFERGATRPESFQSPSGAKQVSTMRQTDRFGYFAGDGFAAVELPYSGNEVSIVFILPDGDHTAFARSLDASYFDWLVSQLRQTHVHVQIPKFEIRTQESLPQILSSMGMPDAFDPKKANFEGIAPADPENPLYVSEVFHEAIISVDEDGTQAAAATAVAMAEGSAGPGAVPEFRADRPFLFAIRDIPTGAVLFLGRVVDP